MSEVSIKALRSERGNIRRQLTNFEKFLSTYNPDKEHPALIKYARELDENRDNFNKIQSKLEALGDGNLSEDGCDEEARNEFEKRYFSLYNSASNILCPRNTTGSSSADQSIHSVNSGPGLSQALNLIQNQISNEISDDFKIPSLGLPSFSGSYDTWLGFHDVFTSMVHNNVKISPILKLRHLRDCLKGEAAELIASVQLSAENYLIAWEIIKET